MKVTGAVSVDLRGALDDLGTMQRHAVEIIDAPPGADVVLQVGERWPDYTLVHQVRDFAQHIGRLTVEGRSDRVRQWVLALRGDQG